MHKISFKNWLNYTESAFTAGTAALAFTPSSDLKAPPARPKDMVKKDKAQEVEHLNNVIVQIQKVLPNKIQLFKNNLNNKMVHSIEPFAEIMQNTELKYIRNFAELDAFLEKVQAAINSVKKEGLEKLDDQKLALIKKVANNIQQIISISEKPETNDEKKKERDLRVIQMIDTDVAPLILGSL